MESIVVNKKALACDIFFAFSANRRIEGKLIQPCVGGGEFTWQVVTPNQQRFDFSFSRDHVVFRADPNDMIRYLMDQFAEFETAYLKR